VTYPVHRLIATGRYPLLAWVREWEDNVWFPPQRRAS